MKTKMINYPKTDKNLDIRFKQLLNFKGLDDEGKPIFLKREVGSYLVEYSEKIHGTNACFVCDENEYWVQSRKRIITIKDDSYGCANFVESVSDRFKKIVNSLAKEYNIDLSQNKIALYFEVAGGNIQKKSALSTLAKSAIIFSHFKVITENEDNYWLPTSVGGRFIDDAFHNIYNTMLLHSFYLQVDFDEYKKTEEIINRKIELIEESSIAGETLGVTGNVGEGFVSTMMILLLEKRENEFLINGKVPNDEILEELKEYFDENRVILNIIRTPDGFYEIENAHPIRSNIMIYIMKISDRIINKDKGQKHSTNTKGAKIKNTNSDKENREKLDIVQDNLATESRLEQFYDEIMNAKKIVYLENTHIGEFIKLIIQDIVNEEQVFLSECKYTLKELRPFISKVSVNYINVRAKNL